MKEKLFSLTFFVFLPLAFADDIFDAVSNGDQKAVEAFLRADPKQVHARWKGNTPLHFAAWDGQRKIAELLIENGAEINAKTADGLTSLHYAVFTRNMELVKLLLKSKADPDAKGPDDITSISWAKEKRYDDIVKLLRQRGAKE